MHEKVLESLREHTMEKNNFKKKKVNLLKYEQQKLYQNSKTRYVSKEK